MKILIAIVIIVLIIFGVIHYKKELDKKEETSTVGKLADEITGGRVMRQGIKAEKDLNNIMNKANSKLDDALKNN